ncbi:DUF58 domain-containing protein [Litoribrevibacter albus]|uniref:DUF58 domain-containing protein n=1 Tax=Litoribrevibacter albus TaxID=1473156 RepID=A0AA37S9E2_9GAMM|nr:DUF58 domain-containing protein [Litoribrevibacter albus]GLQ30725.1 hypothetical protein GCM10007876_12040 [Litoribrevibacter albus]
MLETLFNKRKSATDRPSDNARSHGVVDDISCMGAYADKQTLLQLAAAGSKINLAKATYALSRNSGTHHSNQRGRGMEFIESRHYQPGDDIRSIDWRVTARTGKTHTKVFAEEREQPVFVLCDQSPYMFFGSQVRFKSVQATNIAALIAWSSLKQGDRFGGEILGENSHSELFKLSRNRSRLLQFLEKSVEMNHRLNNHCSANYSALAKKLHQLKYMVTPGTRLYVLSDIYAYTPNALKALAQLSAHTEITLFAINDPLEIEPPCTGQTRISLGGQVMSVLLSKQQQQTIVNHYQNHYQQVVSYLNNWNIPLISVNTTDNPIDLFNTRASKHRLTKRHQEVEQR